jgi:hypothetical protein
VNWTAAAVESLAPDPASVIAARKLARPAPWSETGRDERAVWLRLGVNAGPVQHRRIHSRLDPCLVPHAMTTGVLLRLGDETFLNPLEVGLATWRMFAQLATKFLRVVSGLHHVGRR